MTVFSPRPSTPGPLAQPTKGDSSGRCLPKRRVHCHCFVFPSHHTYIYRPTRFQMTNSDQTTAPAEPIPLLSVPVLNRGDLLGRLVESIDHPVHQLLIINNGRDAAVAGVINRLQAERPDHISQVIVVSPRRNLGVATSWNIALRQLLIYDYPFLIICGSDIQFSPGDLKAFQAAHDPAVAMCFGNHKYSLFSMTPMAVETAGFFDENFFPAYLEDCDYRYRVRLLGLETKTIPGVAAVHGDDSFGESCTIHSDPVIFKRNLITHGRNFEYYHRKWGGSDGGEVFLHPYNNPNLEPDQWTVDLGHIQRNNIWPER